MEKTVTPEVYTAVGVAVVAVLLWLFGWLIPRLVGRSIDARFEKKEREEQEYRKEQIEDSMRTMRGQQVMTDCLHEMLRHMITGNHVDDLERVQHELEAYRESNRNDILKKAAKYNLR